MELRDTLNTEQNYQDIIDKKKQYIDEDLARINERKKDEKDGIQRYPKSNSEIIKSIYKAVINDKCEILKAKYSIGESLSILKEDAINVLSFSDENKILISYANLNMLLCTASMLEIGDIEFKKLLNITENYLNQNNQEDYLIDFLIKSRLPDWKLSDSFILKKPYGNLKKIIDLSEKDKEQASELLKDYIEKLWYKELIEVETHKSKFNTHTGYWSWEAGAIAKILNLDDSSLKDQQYYPYDMVHWKD